MDDRAIFITAWGVSVLAVFLLGMWVASGRGHCRGCGRRRGGKAVQCRCGRVE